MGFYVLTAICIVFFCVALHDLWQMINSNDKSMWYSVSYNIMFSLVAAFLAARKAGVL